jgi:hypothetical protein
MIYKGKPTNAHDPAHYTTNVESKMVYTISIYFEMSTLH